MKTYSKEQMLSIAYKAYIHAGEGMNWEEFEKFLKTELSDSTESLDPVTKCAADCLHKWDLQV
jgi:hypothetical protein